MKKISLLLILLAVMIISFSSCTKEDVSIDNPQIENPITEEATVNSLLDDVSGRSDGEGLDLECFVIDFPFSLDIDGTYTIEINSFDEYENAFVFDSFDLAINVDFVYPLNITYEDGTTADIANGEDLGEAFAQCIPDDGWGEPGDDEGEFPAFLICDLNSCFTMIYPVSLVEIDGTTHVANNEEELIELLSENGFLTFTFPINLEDTDGEAVVAESSEDLFDLLLSCDPWDGWDDQDSTWTDTDTLFDIGGIACYDLVFPLTIVLENGDTQILNGNEDFNSVLLNGVFFDFGYPLTLLSFDTNEQVTVNSQAELEEAIQSCWDDFEPPFFDGDAFQFIVFSDVFEEESCYSINYPLDIVTIDSTTLTFNSNQDVIDSFENEMIDPFTTLVYPVSVTLNTPAGETITIENINALYDLFEDCN